MDTDETIAPMPPAIIKLVLKHARINASKHCQIRNYRKQIASLDADVLAGTIPKFIDYKFKKLYNKPEESGIRSTLIRTAIDQECTRIKLKTQELETEYGQRLAQLIAELNPTLLACNLKLAPGELSEELENHIQSFLVTFLLKQQADTKRKEEKRLKFLLHEEEQQAETIITKKDVSNFTIMIKRLEKQVKTLQLAKKPGKGKGAVPKNPRNTPRKHKGKSTGTGKNRNGKPKDTARNKKYRGLNGNK
jgi:polyhydroxyalkanoate synthesis regulator phasin